MKLRKWILLAMAALLAGSVAVAEARGGGGGGGGGGMGGGGWHGGGGGSGGGGWHGGDGGHGGSWHGGHDGHSHGSVAFFWGFGGWGWPYYGYWPYYYPYYYPYYPAYYSYPYGYGYGYGGYGAYPASTGYVEQGMDSAAPAQAPAAPAAPSYWFYCSNPAGWYPYVKSCSQQWQAVSPPQAGAPTAPPTH